MKIPIPQTLKELAEHLSHPLYLVGGFVRNSILFGHNEDTDMDICGELTPEEMLCEISDIAEIKEVNPRIGTVLIKYKDSFFEYTSFREDSYPIGGQHRPQEVVFVKDMRKDVKRRDFTVNAVYANALTGEVIDLVGGVNDMKNGLIRTVRTPLETFSEDGLRLLRLVRFACELGFDIEKETAEGARASAEQLLDISGERKREELNKILYSDCKYANTGKPSKGMRLIGKLNLWQNINFFEPCYKEMAKKDAEFDFLDVTPKDIRLEIFAWILTGQENSKVTESVFGQYGLRYPKSVVKNLLVAMDFIKNRRENQDLMMFIAKNRDYHNSLELLSQAFDMKLSVADLYEEMLEKSLPFEVKELGIKDEDFVCFGVKNKDRGVALNKILLETYRQKRNLTASEKQKILFEIGEK